MYHILTSYQLISIELARDLAIRTEVLGLGGNPTISQAKFSILCGYLIAS